MAGHDRVGNTGQFPVNHMKVGPADPAGANPDAHLARAGREILAPLKLQRRAGRYQDHGVHVVRYPLTQACAAYRVANAPRLIRVNRTRADFPNNMPTLAALRQRQRLAIS
jgi:hypothetical protein